MKATITIKIPNNPEHCIGCDFHKVWDNEILHECIAFDVLLSTKKHPIMPCEECIKIRTEQGKYCSSCGTQLNNVEHVIVNNKEDNTESIVCHSCFKKLF